MDRDDLLKHITVLDFMAVDLQLFLNTHPDNTEALRIYNEIVACGQKAHERYEAEYGPLVTFRSKGWPDWAWKNEPWPWQEDFNFCLGAAKQPTMAVFEEL